MKHIETFLAFTPDTDEAWARTRYRQRIGGEPAEVKRDDRMLMLVVPVVPEMEEK